MENLPSIFFFANLMIMKIKFYVLIDNLGEWNPNEFLQNSTRPKS